jgi:2-methylisocitrate lyase-like PEP mutase family enzyme
MQRSHTADARKMFKENKFVFMPSAYDAIGGRLIEQTGFKAAYVGGFVTGGSRCCSEPQLSLHEQVQVAGDVAKAIKIPTFADGGAGFGEPLHAMRCVREFIYAGIAGIHIEDQLYPKRAHYHKYVAHAISREEFRDKINYVCRARKEMDPDFIVIARTDTCRFEGLEEAIPRINMAADVGADMGLLFPRNDEEMRLAPRQAKIPLVYVMSTGNRDGRPLPTQKQLEEMGYAAAIDATAGLLAAFTATRRVYRDLFETGKVSFMSTEECIEARQSVEDLIGLEDYYVIEEETVEKKKWGKR